jgi:hypothetical protein
MTRFLAACAAAILLAAGGQPAIAQSAYRFINIADTTGPFIYFQSAISINDLGVVAFNANQDSGVSGIYTGSGGPIATITDTEGPFRHFGPNPAINASGMVAFIADGDASSASGIYTSDGNSLTPIALSGVGNPWFWVAAPSINDKGEVAFYGDPWDPGIAEGVFKGSGGPLTTIADATGPINGPAFRTSINENGAVASAAFRDAGGRGVFRGDGQTLTTISTFIETGTEAAINDSGDVAFLGRSGGVVAIRTGSGGPLTSIVTESAMLRIASSPSINNAGEVVFLGSATGGSFGVYTGSDPLADKVIAVGDELFGSVVDVLINFGLDGPVINNRGEIAFHYELTNGVTGIAVAVPVPEPAGFALLIAASGACVALRYAHRTPRRTSA